MIHSGANIAVSSFPQPDAVRNLLRAAGLPAVELGRHPETTVWTATADDHVQGLAALEQYECYGLLRSVAVAAPYRGAGLGRSLTERALSAARRADLAAVYLLTETAADYFYGLGFVAIARPAVPPIIQQSREFAGLCPDTAVVMVRELHV